MAEKRVIIIGAGLAGLATGIYAQMNGYQAEIFEHANQPGGVSATWKRKNFIIDGGIHFYMGFRPGQPVNDIYRELGVYQAEQYREMDIYARFLDPAEDRTVELTRDLDRFAADLKALSPADTRFIDRIILAAKAFKGANFGAPFAKPPELNRIWDTAKMVLSMRKTLKYYTGGYYSQAINKATEDLEDPWLRGIIEHIFLPDVPVWFMLLILGMLADGNMALRLDGSAGFAKALEKRFTDLGGQVTYRAKVEEIIVENDRAAGIRLADGEEHRTDRVVSAADGYSTIFELLKGRYVNDEIRDRYSNWPLFNPVVMISYGISREFRQDPWMIVLRAARDISAGYLTHQWISTRIFNYSPVFSPSGKTVIQVMAESAWQPWLKLRDDIAAYKAEKQRVAAQILDGFTSIWPGIDRQVEMIDVATPYTYWRYTFNRQGAYEGFAITPDSVRTKIYRTLPGLNNFYLAGQWVAPGGGVIPSLMTGKHAAMMLCHHDGKRFGTIMT